MVALDSDISFMKMALREAVKGTGKTSPNPCVGAVVVQDGKVVGKGWHKKAGTPHAEVNALAAAGDKTRGATIYVTLEPCNHTGRTPPCTRAILAAGIKRVVVGMLDPNPGVKGGGNDFLKEQGLAVSAGIMANRCRAINRPFIKHSSTGLPWVIMKAGLSIDGMIAARTGQSSWITNADSRRYVHRLRHQVDAILVGSGTALTDDPSLTARLAKGRGNDPLRVVLDSHLKLACDCKMLEQQSPAATIIFCRSDVDNGKRQALTKAGAKVITVEPGPENGLDLHQVLAELGRRQITSLLVEGGSGIHASFLRAGLYDQANLFIAPVLIGADGIPLLAAMGFDQVKQAPRLFGVTSRRFGADIMIAGFFAEDGDLVS